MLIDTSSLRRFPRRMLVALIVGAVLLTALSIAGWVSQGRLSVKTVELLLRRFDLRLEMTVPAWYSASMLLAAAALLWTIARLAQRNGDRDARRWLILAGIFILLSCDEAASIHELLTYPLRSRFGLRGVFYYAWVIPGAIGVVALGLYYLPMVRRLSRATRRGVILAAAVYLSGVLVWEAVGGMLAERHGYDAPSFLASVVIEEMSEMLGAALFLHTLTRHLLLERLGLTPGNRAVITLAAGEGSA